VNWHRIQGGGINRFPEKVKDLKAALNTAEEENVSCSMRWCSVRRVPKSQSKSSFHCWCWQFEVLRQSWN
jgi:hypothetical protein